MKRIPKELRSIIMVAVLFVVVMPLAPAQGRVAGAASLEYLKEMALILPPVFFLIGLLEMWVPRSMVEKYLGRKSGIAGFVISALLGSVAVGPMYAAFPFARTLLDKGTSLFNVVVFLTMWAAGKIPTVMMEAKFMGVEFALLRLGLTVAASVVIAWVMQRLASPQVSAQPSAIEDRVSRNS
ncbi:MAG: permease [Firmicutes bacterium]|nr:permease [Bacillota bacterium]